MPDPKHLELIHQGVDVWNAWRRENPVATPDLSKANLSGANLEEANLMSANLSEANLSGANLSEADLSGANLWAADLNGANFSKANLRVTILTSVKLRGADLSGADLWAAYLRGADLSKAILSETTNLREANLTIANLTEANLSGANLREATLVNADLTGADLTGCRIYGVSAWALKLDTKTKQKNLVITREDESEVTTDDIEVAQFLYVMLHNEKVRRVIDTITSKVVLILGRFTPERKAVLDALRDELRKPGRAYVPVVFDFDKPRSQTTVETVTLLARMARFVIADLSDAKSVLLELQAIVPSSPKLAVQPVIIATQDEPGMFDSIEIYRSVLKTHCYNGLEQLKADLDENVIRPIEAKVVELRGPQPE
jgi:uncharacterized protein YjbI with pentapeptide repeats